MTFRRALAIAIACVALVPSFLHAKKAKLDIKPGKWKTTVKIQSSKLPMQMQPFTHTHCITRGDIDKEKLAPQAEQPGQQCTIQNQQVKDSTVTWTMKCKNPQGMTMTGKGKVTYQATRYSGHMQMQMSGAGMPTGMMTMRYDMTGKRIGACKKAQ